MRKILYFILAVPFIMSILSCQNMGKFTYTKTRSIPVVFDINVDGAYSYEKFVAEYDINKPFDIDESATISKVTINSLNIQIEDLPGSDAEFLDLEAEVAVKSSSFPFVFEKLVEKGAYKRVPVSFTAASSFLNGSGVNKVKEFLQKMLNPIGDNSTTYATIKINGKAYSILFSGQKINAKVSLIINATVTYELCEEVGINVFGASCTDEY